MKRRTFLTASTAAITALAGCGGSDTEYEDGNSGASDGSTKGTSESSGSSKDVELLEHELVQGSYSTKVEGKAKNVSDKQLSYIQVNVRFYDEAGTQIESSLDNVNDLGAGRSWAFEVLYPGTDGEQIADYDIAVKAGF